MFFLKKYMCLTKKIVPLSLHGLIKTPNAAKVRADGVAPADMLWVGWPKHCALPDQAPNRQQIPKRACSQEYFIWHFTVL